MTLTSFVLVNISVAKEGSVENPSINRRKEAEEERRELGEEILNLRPQDI